MIIKTECTGVNPMYVILDEVFQPQHPVNMILQRDDPLKTGNVFSSTATLCPTWTGRA
jgi:hypothetical protein